MLTHTLEVGTYLVKLPRCSFLQLLICLGMACASCLVACSDSSALTLHRHVVDIQQLLLLMLMLLLLVLDQCAGRLPKTYGGLTSSSSSSSSSSCCGWSLLL
jgi:hypothetical protein